MDTCSVFTPVHESGNVNVDVRYMVLGTMPCSNICLSDVLYNLHPETKVLKIRQLFFVRNDDIEAFCRFREMISLSMTLSSHKVISLPPMLVYMDLTCAIHLIPRFPPTLEVLFLRLSECSDNDELVNRCISMFDHDKLRCISLCGFNTKALDRFGIRSMPLLRTLSIELPENNGVFDLPHIPKGVTNLSLFANAMYNLLWCRMPRNLVTLKTNHNILMPDKTNDAPLSLLRMIQTSLGPITAMFRRKWKVPPSVRCFHIDDWYIPEIMISKEPKCSHRKKKRVYTASVPMNAIVHFSRFVTAFVPECNCPLQDWCNVHVVSIEPENHIQTPVRIQNN